MLAFVNLRFTGLLPCKVMRIVQDGIGEYNVTVQYTARRAGYPRGAQCSYKSWAVAPRQCVRKSRQHIGQSYFMPYGVQAD